MTFNYENKPVFSAGGVAAGTAAAAAQGAIGNVAAGSTCKVKRTNLF